MAPRLPRHDAAPTPRPDRRSRRLLRQGRLLTHLLQNGTWRPRWSLRSAAITPFGPPSLVAARAAATATVGPLGDGSRRDWPVPAARRTDLDQTVPGDARRRRQRLRSAAARCLGPPSVGPAVVIAAFTSSASPPSRPRRHRNEAGEPRRRCRPVDATGRGCAPLAAAGAPDDEPRRHSDRTAASATGDAAGDAAGDTMGDASGESAGDKAGDASMDAAEDGTGY